MRKLIVLSYLSILVALAQTTNPTANVTISGTVTSNVTKWNGTTVDTNSGTKSAGTLRVVIATDQPALTNKLLVTPDSVALPANQSVNINQSNGSAMASPCDKQAFVNLTNSSLTTLVAVSGATAIRICGLVFAGPAPADVKLQYGTAASCGSGTTDLTALFKTVTSFDLMAPFGTVLAAAPASNGVCIIQTTSQAAGVHVIYGQN